MHHHAVYDLIDRIYENALSPGGPDRVSALLNRTFDGEMTNIVEQSAISLDGFVVASAGQSPQYIEEFARRFARQNPWARRFCPQTRVGEVMLGESTVHLLEMEKTPFYNDYMKQQNLYRWMGTLVSYRGTTGRILSISRSRRTGDFDRDARVVFGMLTPHVVRSLDCWNRLKETELRSETLYDSFNRIADGVVILSEYLEVLEINDAAARILADDDGIAVRNRKLSPSKQTLAAKLTALLAALLPGSEKRDGGNCLRIARPSRKSPYLLTAIPMAKRCAEQTPDRDARPSLMVFLKDPERLTPNPSPLFVDAWHFSKSECAVAAKLLEGEDLSRIAAELFVSMNTVKSHLKKILEKSETHRQGEFIAKAYKSLAGI